jgi:hypothetical protein
MCNVQMIRNEPGLVSIPLERAVFCGNCQRVSNSAWRRCGSCGSDKLLELARLLGGPWEPGPEPPATSCVMFRLAS